MGLQIRDDRQMKALTGLSQAQFDSLLAPSSATSTRPHSKKAMKTGSNSVREGANLAVASKGNCQPWRRELQFVLYQWTRPDPTFDVLGQQFAMARSKANENLHIALTIRLRLRSVRPHALARVRNTGRRRKRLRTGWIARSLMPPNGLITRSTDEAKQRVSITAEKKQHTLENTGQMALS